MKQLIDYSDFNKFEIAVGTILSAELNPKALTPTYILSIDFGELGQKLSSAQLTENYQLEDLISRQIVGVMNFLAKRIAGIKSEVLVLASVSEADGTILLQPSYKVRNGSSFS